MGVPNPSAPTEFWTDWLGFMADAIGVSDPRYIWWSNLVGRSYSIYPTTTELFCSLGPYTFEDLTMANFAQYGPATIFVHWLQDYVYSIYCVDDTDGGGGGSNPPPS